MSRIGENIKKAREKKGLSQKQLAKKLGVAENYINEVEAGKKVIGENLITRVTKILGQEMNDITMSFEEEAFREEKTNAIPNIITKPNKKQEVNEVWSEAFGSVLKDVPVYKYDLNEVLYVKQLPVVSNKVEGHSVEKVLFIEIQDDDMIGFRMAKGDIAFGYITSEIENNSICLIEHNSERVIREVKKLDNTKLLLISNKGTIKTETVTPKDIKVLAKLTRLEIKL